jgi:ATP/maltotriose-dependent transcriptional regulator MalT
VERGAFHRRLLKIAHACLSCLERHSQQFHTEEARAALAEAHGCVLLGEKRSHESAENFRQAVSSWEMIDRRYDQARSLGYLGRALTIQGDLTGARATFSQALGIIDSLSNQLDPDRRALFRASPMVEEILGASASVSHNVLSKNLKQDASGLTEREVEVLKLVAEGLTNAQIANRLTLSPLTVNAHLRSIFNKLDVTTRTAAVHQASERGLV